MNLYRVITICLVIILASLYMVVDLKYSKTFAFDEVETNLTIKNSDPRVNIKNLSSFKNGPSVDLIVPRAGGTEDYYVMGEVGDSNGAGDIKGGRIDFTFFRSDLNSYCEEDLHSCYKVTSEPDFKGEICDQDSLLFSGTGKGCCMIEDCNQSICDYICRFDINYTAVPTDKGHYKDLNWIAQVEVSDVSGATSQALDVNNDVASVKLLKFPKKIPHQKIEYKDKKASFIYDIENFGNEDVEVDINNVTVECVDEEGSRYFYNVGYEMVGEDDKNKQIRFDIDNFSQQIGQGRCLMRIFVDYD